MMSRFRLLAARLLGQESVFLRCSAHPESLFAELAGKSISLVGNSRALAETANGIAIDAADIVIRINSAPLPATLSHGARTDWIALSTPIDAQILAQRGPSRLLWMTRKRRRLGWAIAHRPGFYLNRREDVQSLRNRLGAAPTTGLMMIDLLARSDFASLHLYGFDFFASQSLSGHRTAAQVPHDFAAERMFVETLIASDPRIHLVA